MRVRFWGVRGSIPTPLTPAEIESKVITLAEDVVRAGITDPSKVAGYLRETHGMMVRGTVGGNTTCLSFHWPGATVVIDAGSGIRNLGRYLMEDGPFAKGQGQLDMLITHTHWDHIQGFPFFGPLFQRNVIRVHGGHEGLEQRFAGQQHSSYFPVPLNIFPAKISFDKVKEDRDYELPGGGRYRMKRVSHPGECYAYRIEHEGTAVVFATDAEIRRSDDSDVQSMAEFVKDADLFIFDSQYTLEESMIKEDWGHSTAVVGVDVAVQAGVKKLALFHHEPNYPDNFIRELLLKARRYQEINHPDASLEIFPAIEGMDLRF